MLVFNQSVLPLKCETIYAGTVLNTKTEQSRTTRACAKARQIIASLRDVGVTAGGMNPLTNVRIWRRVILTSAFYGCELWANIKPSEIKDMEILQRYFSRLIQNFHRRSSRDATIQTLGLWSMQATIDKLKIIYLGRLCRTKSNNYVKTLFFFRIAQYRHDTVHRTSVIHSLLETTAKYDLIDYVYAYTTDGYFPNKTVWNRITCENIQTHEENNWNDSLIAKPELSRFHSIHERLATHRLWNVCEMGNLSIKPIYALVKLGVIPISSGQCSFCDVEDDDIVRHQILKCNNLVRQRNTMYEHLFDNLSLSDYMKFEDCESDTELLVTLLGGITKLVEDMSLETWIKCIYVIATNINSWNLQFILHL